MNDISTECTYKIYEIAKTPINGKTTKLIKGQFSQ